MSVTATNELVLGPSMGWYSRQAIPITRGMAMILAGIWGGGKSTIQRQLALALAEAGHRVLLIVSEEDAATVCAHLYKLAERFGPQAAEILSRVHIIGDPGGIAAVLSVLNAEVFSESGRYRGVDAVFFDSIQGFGVGLKSDELRAWSAAQARCLAEGLAVVAIAQSSKNSEVAGRAMIPHMADSVFVFQKNSPYRFMIARKTRGFKLPRPVVLEFNGAWLEPSLRADALAVTAITFAERGRDPVRIQARICVPDGRKACLGAPNLPRAEVKQILGLLKEVSLPDFEFSDEHLDVLLRMPGHRGYRATYGFPLAAAVLATYLRRSLPVDALFCGELDLQRKILPLSDTHFTDLVSAARLRQLGSVSRVFCSPINAALAPEISGCRFVGVEKLDDIAGLLWPELRPAAAREVLL